MTLRTATISFNGATTGFKHNYYGGVRFQRPPGGRRSTARKQPHTWGIRATVEVGLSDTRYDLGPGHGHAAAASHAW